MRIKQLVCSLFIILSVFNITACSVGVSGHVAEKEQPSENEG